MNVRPAQPKTEIWALPYARLNQLDGNGNRNILIERTRAEPPTANPDQTHGDDMLLLAEATFPQTVIEAHLRTLGMPHNTPLGIVAVELLIEPEGRGFEDPLGADLGQVRILRSSTLHAVPSNC